MQGDWLSGVFSWGEDRAKDEGEHSGQGRLRDEVTGHQLGGIGDSVFNTQRWSLEKGGRPWGIPGTEKPPRSWQKRDRGAWEG